MKITIRFAGTMKVISGCERLEVDIPDKCKLRDFLHLLAKQLPAEFTKQIIQPVLQEEQLSRAIMLVNQKIPAGNKLLDLVLVDGDEVVFVPPMEGG